MIGSQALYQLRKRTLRTTTGHAGNDIETGGSVQTVIQTVQSIVVLMTLIVTSMIAYYEHVSTPRALFTSIRAERKVTDC